MALPMSQRSQECLYETLFRRSSEREKHLIDPFQKVNKIHQKTHRYPKKMIPVVAMRLLVTVGGMLVTLSAAVAQESSMSQWAGGKYATGDWFGARTTLEDRGIYATGDWKGVFYGIVDGGLDQRGSFDEEINLKLKLDLEKLAGLGGLSLHGAVRWRDGENPNYYVGASPAFNPSHLQVGKQWRLMPFYAMWESRGLLPVQDMVTVSGGWTNPYYFFIQQPESKLFVNNALQQTKGLTNSGFPWSGAYNTWGGHIKIKPTEWSYAQAGLYMAVPTAKALSTANHGLYFEGAYPQDSNGLYFIGETGVTPKFAGLPGKFAVGSIVYGIENTSFFGEKYDSRYTFYFQADQMLFREASPEPEPMAKGPSDGKGVASDKSFKEPVDVAAPKPGMQGLYFFSFLDFAPKYNNAMPFYFHSGLVYKGLIPTRDEDQLGIAFAYGNYSYYKILAEQDTGRSIHQTYEAVLEVDYRAQITKFVYAQPFFQYIIRPNGTDLVENASIVGAQFGVTF
jgi:porin